MNPVNILGLISDLYEQVRGLTEQAQALAAQRDAAYEQLAELRGEPRPAQ